ncbi:SDR family NAD(P)-dependent oxidoreductase [Pseudopelagicola sp. nBUS_19]|uniref:SDR family NAD(P)-dependent oxidoreductase n=1 Tax=Pseudopelagicola sp. nBUS_19 TaxID=3395316 RepID=UPI003EBDA91F
MTFKGKTYWLVGASEGLGRALAQALSAKGARVILSARNVQRLAALSNDLDNSVALPVDVTKATSVAAAAREIFNRPEKLDGMIYCAGAYEPMRAQDWDSTAAELMGEVNYMGAMRVLSHVVPAMVAKKSGHIVLIGSLAGFRGLPGAIGYGSSKAAVMHIAENLHADLHSTGVQVQCLNPGFIETRLTNKNQFSMPQLMKADQAANFCMRAMSKTGFSASFPAPFSLLFTLGRFMPLNWFQGIFRRSGNKPS